MELPAPIAQKVVEHIKNSESETPNVELLHLIVADERLKNVSLEEIETVLTSLIPASPTPPPRQVFDYALIKAHDNQPVALFLLSRWAQLSDSTLLEWSMEFVNSREEPPPEALKDALAGILRIQLTPALLDSWSTSKIESRSLPIITRAMRLLDEEDKMRLLPPAVHNALVSNSEEFSPMTSQMIMELASTDEGLMALWKIVDEELSLETPAPRVVEVLTSHITSSPMACSLLAKAANPSAISTFPVPLTPSSSESKILAVRLMAKHCPDSAKNVLFGLAMGADQDVAPVAREEFEKLREAQSSASSESGSESVDPPPKVHNPHNNPIR